MRVIYKIIIGLVLFLGLFSGLFFGALHITSQYNIKEDSTMYVSCSCATENIPDILPYTTPNNIDKSLNTSSSTQSIVQTSTPPATKTSTQKPKCAILIVKQFEKYENNIFEVDSDEIEIFNPKLFTPEWYKEENYLDKADEKSTNPDSRCPNSISKTLFKLGYNIEDTIILHNGSYLLMVASPKNLIKNVDKYCQSMKPEINKLIENISSNLKQGFYTTETAKLINVFETTLDFIKEYGCQTYKNEKEFRDQKINLISTNRYTKMVLNFKYNTLARTKDYTFHANYSLFVQFYQ